MARLTEKELIERERELNLVIEISEAVIGQLRLDELFKMVVENARKLINAETVLIPILDRDKSSYTYVAGCGKNADDIVGESLPIAFGICGWVWKNKKPWWRGALDLLSESEKNRWEKDAGSIILVPLIGKNYLHGGIAGFNKIGGGNFSRRDLDLLIMFASQVSIAIENAQSYQELEYSKNRAEKYQIELNELNSKLIFANKELENMALYDHLTKIPNRSLIRDRLEQAIIKNKSNRLKVAVIILDLDYFKNVNDSFGHTIGEQLLQHVAQRLKDILPDQITFGRVGGDEFALVVPDSSINEFEKIAELVKSALESPFVISGHQILINGSIGISIYPDHGESVEILFNRAETAMYLAKETKSRFTVYNFLEDRFTKDRLNLIADLKKAIVTGRLELYYQPKYKTGSTNEIKGVEALARWPHPIRGMIFPDIFISLIEETGMFRDFTDWLLEQGINKLAEWKKRGIDLSMSLNISMFNLRDPLFPETLCNLLNKYKVDFNSIILEITESAVMGDMVRVPKVLAELSAKGIQFSIDDFGTGYSSLVHLKKLHVDELKIDKTFIMGMKSDKEDEIIVRSTIDLSHNLGLRVVAEGVENLETLKKLEEMGCDEIQGFYFSEPLTEKKLLRILKII